MIEQTPSLSSNGEPNPTSALPVSHKNPYPYALKKRFNVTGDRRDGCGRMPLLLYTNPNDATV